MPSADSLPVVYDPVCPRFLKSDLRRRTMMLFSRPHLDISERNTHGDRGVLPVFKASFDSWLHQRMIWLLIKIIIQKRIIRNKRTTNATRPQYPVVVLSSFLSTTGLATKRHQKVASVPQSLICLGPCHRSS
jgi:hypothetical protein